VTAPATTAPGAAAPAAGPERPLRTLLICHDGAPLHEEGLARWLASFSTLAGVLVLREPPGRTKQRVKREFKRAGAVGFADVVAFRAYYKAVHAAADHAWVGRTLDRLRARYAPVPTGVPRMVAASPNAPGSEAFVRDCAPDMAFALCKTLLKKSVFSIPRLGTYVFHPGVCPEYRNAHGCFWALATRDVGKVGMTLLRIDEGVDTGPTYGYFSYPMDEVAESHYVIQNRVVLDNLDALRDTLLAIRDGRAPTVDTHGRPSAVWGQPRLSAWLRWKRAARRARARGAPVAPLADVPGPRFVAGAAGAP
jgi:hypothetical protein